MVIATASPVIFIVILLYVSHNQVILHVGTHCLWHNKLTPYKPSIIPYVQKLCDDIYHNKAYLPLSIPLDAPNAMFGQGLS